MLAGVISAVLSLAPAAPAKQTLRVQIILAAAGIKHIKDVIIPEFERTHDVTSEPEYSPGEAPEQHIGWCTARCLYL